MACNIEQLQKFLDAELEGAELTSYSEHLGSCQVCRGRVERHQSREKFLRDRIRAGLPVGTLTPLVMPKIKVETGPHSSFPWLVIIVGVLIVAGLFLAKAPEPSPNAPATFDPLREPLPGGRSEPGFPAIVAGVGGCMIETSHLKPGLRITLGMRQMVGVGGQAVFIPEPGQEITIQGRSRSVFTREAILWQNGDAELSFKLTKPFQVVLGDSYLTIRGTVIKIKGEVNDTVQVQLIRGAADLTTPQGVKTLTAGQIVAVTQTVVEAGSNATVATPSVVEAPQETTIHVASEATHAEVPVVATETGVSSVTLQGNPYGDAPVVVPGSR